MEEDLILRQEMTSHTIVGGTPNMDSLRGGISSRLLFDLIVYGPCGWMFKTA